MPVGVTFRGLTSVPLKRSRHLFFLEGDGRNLADSDLKRVEGIFGVRVCGKNPDLGRSLQG